MPFFQYQSLWSGLFTFCHPNGSAGMHQWSSCAMKSWKFCFCNTFDLGLISYKYPQLFSPCHTKKIFLKGLIVLQASSALLNTGRSSSFTTYPWMRYNHESILTPTVLVFFRLDLLDLKYICHWFILSYYFYRQML